MSLIKAIEKGNLAKVQEMIASGVNVNQIDRETDETPLQQAADNGHLEIVRALLEAGATLNSEHRSPLEAATWNGHIEVVRLLTQFYPYSEIHRDAYNESLLVATILGNVEIVECLLAAGMDVNAIIGDRGTALHYAAERVQMAVAHRLIAAGADVNSRNTSEKAYDSFNRTPLMEAIRTSVEIFQLLLQAGADVNLTDQQGQTLLMISAEGDRTDLPQQLINAGAAVNAQDSQGRTALMIAADQGNSAFVKLLIAAGADVNLRDRNGNTALTYAEQSDPDVIENELAEEENLLCKSERYHKTLEIRKVLRQQRIGKYLREAGATEQGIKELMLVKAAAQGKLGEVEALIDTGVEINQIVPNYGTALLQAVIKGHQEIVAALLAEGADPNIYANANPPIIKAAENGFLEIVRMLLDAEANPHVTDSDMEDWEGYTALDRAQMKGHTEIVQLLRARSGKRQRKLPVCEWRGLVSDNLNDRLILVQATVAQAAEALCHVRGATVWEQNVFEQEVELTNECFVVFQFTGHTWTVIHEENVYSWHDGLKSQDAQRLSQHLQVKVIYYSVSDTAGAIGYELYESGELLEEFDYYCEHDFRDRIESGGEPDTVYGRSCKLYSKLRQINSSELQQEFDFVDTFFKSQDAYVPAWGGLSHICGTGKRRKLQVTGLDPADLQMNYVAVQR